MSRFYTCAGPWPKWCWDSQGKLLVAMCYRARCNLLCNTVSTIAWLEAFSKGQWAPGWKADICHQDNGWIFALWQWSLPSIIKIKNFLATQAWNELNERLQNLFDTQRPQGWFECCISLIFLISFHQYSDSYCGPKYAICANYGEIPNLQTYQISYLRGQSCAGIHRARCKLLWNTVWTMARSIFKGPVGPWCKANICHQDKWWIFKHWQ